jgi:hypothetical protein
MADISDYKKILEQLAINESEDFINNSSIEHAAAMIEELFKNAAGTVSILTGHLNPNVYGRSEIRDTVERFIQQGPDNRIDIIVQNGEDADIVKLSSNGLIIALRNFKDKVRLYAAKSEELIKLPNHFMVLKTTKGNYALRFEMDLDKYTATGTFNGGNVGEKLYKYFQSCIVNNSKAYEVSRLALWPQN